MGRLEICLLNQSLLLSSFLLVIFFLIVEDWTLSLIQCIWSVMTEIRVEEGISYLLELMEEISAKILWYVSNDMTNAMSMIQVMLVC